MPDKTPPAKGAPPEQPDATPADSAYTQWYEVKKGDTLYPDIFKANQDTLSDPDKIQVGQKLRIP
jgi:nucleoid-associated protein YgaU